MSISLVLYTSKKLADGRHPVMLQVIQGKEIKRLSVGISCFATEWDEDGRKLKRSHPDHQNINKTLRRKLQEAEELWDEIAVEGLVDLTSFFAFLKGEKKRTLFILDMFDQIIEEMKVKNKIGNMNKYKQVRNRVKQYKGNTPFQAIDYKYLQGFEVFLFSKGAKEGGVNFNMRTVRAVYNRAILEGYVDQKHYPFFSQLNRKGYSLGHLKSEHKPRPLSPEDLEKIKNFPFEEHPSLSYAIYYFLFSYYCNGMSFIDMCFLKRENVQNNRIHYIRRKTKRPMPSIKITEPIQKIIDWFGGEDYLFPVLIDERHITEQQKYNRYLKMYGQYNNDLKEVARIVGISINLTSYTSRHSFGNILKKKGVDLGKIIEMYGHADVEATKHYLEKFDDEHLDDAHDML